MMKLLNFIFLCILGSESRPITINSEPENITDEKNSLRIGDIIKLFLDKDGGQEVASNKINAIEPTTDGSETFVGNNTEEKTLYPSSQTTENPNFNDQEETSLSSSAKALAADYTESTSGSSSILLNLNKEGEKEITSNILNETESTTISPENDVAGDNIEQTFSSSPQPADNPHYDNEVTYATENIGNTSDSSSQTPEEISDQEKSERIARVLEKRIENLKKETENFIKIEIDHLKRENEDIARKIASFINKNRNFAKAKTDSLRRKSNALKAAIEKLEEESGNIIKVKVENIKKEGYSLKKKLKSLKKQSDALKTQIDKNKQEAEKFIKSKIGTSKNESAPLLGEIKKMFKNGISVFKSEEVDQFGFKRVKTTQSSKCFSRSRLFARSAKYLSIHEKNVTSQYNDVTSKMSTSERMMDDTEKFIQTITPIGLAETLSTTRRVNITKKAVHGTFKKFHRFTTDKWNDTGSSIKTDLVKQESSSQNPTTDPASTDHQTTEFHKRTKGNDLNYISSLTTPILKESSTGTQEPTIYPAATVEIKKAMKYKKKGPSSINSCSTKKTLKSIDVNLKIKKEITVTGKILVN